MSRRRAPATVTLLAGWLFADLLLGLTIIMLGAQAPPLTEPKPVTATSGSKPAQKGDPCVNRVGGVRPKPTKVSFQVISGAGDSRLAKQVKKALRKIKSKLKGRRAGMVLTFASNSGSGGGVHLAGRVNTALRTAYPTIFQGAATRNFHDLAAAGGSISMEIYFVSDGCAPQSKK